MVRIGIALSEALEHAHGRGVIHRDVKPANVIVPERAAGELGLAKLTDFGVAAIAGDDALTRTGDVVGTLAYMAPEQAEGARVTGAADLYALALVLYEALSGSTPSARAAPPRPHDASGRGCRHWHACARTSQRAVRRDRPRAAAAIRTIAARWRGCARRSPSAARRRRRAVDEPRDGRAAADARAAARGGAGDRARRGSAPAAAAPSGSAPPRSRPPAAAR